MRRQAAAAAMVGEAMAIWNRRSRSQPARLSWAARRMSPRLWAPGSAGLPVPVTSCPGSWHGPAGAGPQMPVMVMPCSRATWVRNLRGMPVSASSCRRFLAAVMYSRSKNSRVKMPRACCRRCPDHHDLGGIRTVHMAVWKRPVKGLWLVRRLSIDGGGVGDLAALLVAPAHPGE